MCADSPYITIVHLKARCCMLNLKYGSNVQVQGAGRVLILGNNKKTKSRPSQRHDIMQGDWRVQHHAIEIPTSRYCRL